MNNPWKDAILNELIVIGIYSEKHDNDPRLALNDAIKWNVATALDPLVSELAQELIEHGKNA